jgi:hypothetical protein
MITNLWYSGLPVKYPLLLDFIETDFLDKFSKSHQMLNFITFSPVTAMLFHVDRWMDGRPGVQTDGQR